MKAVGRSIGLDVHRDICEVANAEDGSVRSAGRVETTPERLELFAQSVGADDRVALERLIAREALRSPEARRLMTVPA